MARKTVFEAKRSDSSVLGARLSSLPLGSFYGMAHGRRYVVSRSLVAGGRGQKLTAHAVGGADYISLNLYHLAAGDLLKPCEMPAAKVVAFVLALEPVDITPRSLVARPALRDTPRHRTAKGDL